MHPLDKVLFLITLSALVLTAFHAHHVCLLHNPNNEHHRSLRLKLFPLAVVGLFFVVLALRLLGWLPFVGI